MSQQVSNSEPSAQEHALPVSTYLFQRSKVRLIGLLALPMTWLVGVYIVSLFLLLITAFWVINPFTSRVSPGFTLDNFISIIAVPAYLSTSLRTLGMALAVTAIATLFAVPLGIYMAKIASPFIRNFLAVAITLPLWAGYLVKILAMRLVFTENGFINWAFGPLGIQSPGFNIWVAIVTLTYLWFPYMALPVFTAIRQIPNSLFDASADMGAKSFTTIFRVVMPLIVPAIIAGSVFTFSLSLGDYLAARFTGGATQMIGSIIASNINLNPPVAAAFSMVPIAFVVMYLMVARRTGSLERM
ncbi:MAG: ABC transporter permease [Microbacteriaceae bacterium]|jgi:putative spermidine/putrescine transport system permease protein|nr:ABC transporter permease [Microbacteriaceae bacterium]MBT5248198.1 ABC transporter permease [Microbacteriaceae bacterium]MBT5616699.1 ABC transporter permease [Microbacteriaceae bacterium]MBT5730162.1 ABC transporter permease [Microbacteriaceae bacterium]MBT7803237.1 ABC transporter permease [Microbacteriaceae bacterium]